MNVPFVDLRAQYQALKEELQTAVHQVFEESSYILGPQVEAFEKSFAEFLNVPHASGVASGTDAIRLACQALEIGTGDEVVLPAHTFIASAIGIVEAGATPVLVDVDPQTFLIDPSLIESVLTPNTRAICPVHLYGRACDMKAIMALAEAHNLVVIEDAAQAHGASWKGSRLGTIGNVGCFSFYPSKNLGAFGDGGAIVCSDSELNQRIRAIRNYGSEQKYSHPLPGINSRLDTLQAALLNVKLPHLLEWNAVRYKLASKYSELLKPLATRGSITIPELPPPEEHAFHLYVVTLPERDKLRQYLQEQGVTTVIHYPNPFYLETGYAQLGYSRGDFPVTESLCSSVLSLPLFPEMTPEQLSYVVEKVNEFFQ